MNKIGKIILPAAALVIGGAIAVGLVKTKPKAKRNQIQAKPALVEVISAKREKKQVRLTAMGTVVPAKEVELKAEVSGRVTYLNPKFVTGGRIKKGQVMIRLDSREYKLAVDQQTAQVERAEVELAMERGRSRIAKREWGLIGKQPDTSEEGQALALRKPQMKSAQAALEGARSGLERAKLNVKRTAVVAPFNLLVKQENVEIGQLVTPQARLAMAVGTDRFWVQVSIPMSKLAWIKIPGVTGEEGSKVTVTQEMGEGGRIQRTGRVIRLLGDLDPQGRMARLILEVDDPLGMTLKEESGSKLPMLLGAYVQVDIEGTEAGDVFVLPRTAVREGDKLWVVADNKLRIKPITVAWRGKTQVYISEGLTPGSKVVVTRLSTPVEGMPLRVEGKKNGRNPVAGKGR